MKLARKWLYVKLYAVMKKNEGVNCTDVCEAFYDFMASVGYDTDTVDNFFS